MLFRSIKELSELPATFKVEMLTKVFPVSRKTAYEMIRQEGFPAIRVSEKRIIIVRDRLIDWINQKASQSLE